jgi:hypothetical protein
LTASQKHTTASTPAPASGSCSRSPTNAPASRCRHAADPRRECPGLGSLAVDTRVGVEQGNCQIGRHRDCGTCQAAGRTQLRRPHAIADSRGIHARSDGVARAHVIAVPIDVGRAFRQTLSEPRVEVLDLL